jgi:hypothetical protein
VHFTVDRQLWALLVHQLNSASHAGSERMADGTEAGEREQCEPGLDAEHERGVGGEGVPLLTTATRFPFPVYRFTASGQSRMARQGRATPGV